LSFQITNNIAVWGQAEFYKNMTWVWIIIVVVLIGGVWFLMKGKKKEAPKTEEKKEGPTNPTM
jgi:TM2 domain-containing membrane protein YozV